MDSPENDKEHEGMEAAPELGDVVDRIDEELKKNKERRNLFGQWLQRSTYFITETSDLALDGAKDIAGAYVKLIFAAAEVTAEVHQVLKDSMLGELGKAVSAKAYYRNVRQLAERMEAYSIFGKSGTDEGIWLAAESHIESMIDGILRTNRSAAETLRSLAETLQTFSSESHLSRIQRRAFEIWESSTKEHGPLHYWLIAEREFLKSMRKGFNGASP